MGADKIEGLDPVETSGWSRVALEWLHFAVSVPLPGFGLIWEAGEC